MRMWLVNPYDPIPGDKLRPGRYTWLSAMMAQRGHQITWLTSNFFHATKSYRAGPHYRTELDGSLRLVMLPTPPYHANVGMRRVLNHLVYSRQLRQWALKESGVPDVILASSPPLSSARAAANLASRLRARLVVDVQDLWPESCCLIAPDQLEKLVALAAYPLKRYADATYAAANGLVAINEALLERALAARPTEERQSALVTHLGVDLEFFDEYRRGFGNIDRANSRRRVTVTYVGTVGDMYDVATVVRAAGLCGSAMLDARFLIVGTGPRLAEMQALAERLRLDNVTFTGFVEYQRVVQLLLESDIAINAVAPGHEHAFPNKVFDYMAAALPIVNSANGELARLIDQKNIGRQYAAGHPQSLVEALVELKEQSNIRREMGRRARQLAEERFDRNRCYGDYIDFLERIAADQPHVAKGI
jgi:glycosyltransferase involved in cell wall biosynthesis